LSNDSRGDLAEKDVLPAEKEAIPVSTSRRSSAASGIAFAWDHRREIGEKRPEEGAKMTQIGRRSAARRHIVRDSQRI